MIQLPKHQIDGTNSGSRLKVGLTFGTLRKASWLVAKGLVIAEGPRTSRNLTGNALPVEVARRPSGRKITLGSFPSGSSDFRLRCRSFNISCQPLPAIGRLFGLAKTIFTK